MVVEQAAICRGAAVPVNEHHYPLGHLPQAGCNQDQFRKTQDGHRACMRIGGHSAAANGPSVDLIALFHYVIRSWEDFKVKEERGPGDGGGTKTAPFFRAIDRFAPRWCS